ncbi:MAG: hypothetical protein RLZZ177_1306, partial [Pseudomonadota bacterium]
MYIVGISYTLVNLILGRESQPKRAAVGSAA